MRRLRARHAAAAATPTPEDIAADVAALESLIAPLGPREFSKGDELSIEWGPMGSVSASERAAAAAASIIVVFDAAAVAAQVTICHNGAAVASIPAARGAVVGAALFDLCAAAARLRGAWGVG